jgi:NAD(P)-dependent dehydrogenase (short-subunit alcohol dehydrogenase family)
MSGSSRTVIVTGGGGPGCGRAIAMAFGLRGDAVIVSDIDEDGGNETVRRIERGGGQATFFRVDVRDESQVRDLVAFAERTFGGLHVLVNNASAAHHDEGIQHWMTSVETDLLGALYATRWAVETMRKNGGGAIVNIASISAMWHGRTTPGGFPGYDVAKAGMIRMTTRLASLATDGIRVNCLAPGWIATDGIQSYWESLSPAERVARNVPSRLLSIEQIANSVVRLADDRSLAGRVVAWWSESAPRLIEWGDRGYHDFVEWSWDSSGDSKSPGLEER